MLDNISNELLAATQQFHANIPLVTKMLVFLYLFLLLNWLLGYRLNYLGIYPRKFFGLFGIVFAPVLHANFNHFFFNAIPLFILANLVLFNGMNTFICVTTVTVLIGGFLTWLFGRAALHIGASGLIMGYWAYLLLNAYTHVSVISIALAGVCIYYFGSMILNLFPNDVKSSWEMHVFGLIGGLSAAYACPEHFCAYLPNWCMY